MRESCCQSIFVDGVALLEDVTKQASGGSVGGGGGASEFLQAGGVGGAGGGAIGERIERAICIRFVDGVALHKGVTGQASGRRIGGCRSLCVPDAVSVTSA